MDYCVALCSADQGPLHTYMEISSGQPRHATDEAVNAQASAEATASTATDVPMQPTHPKNRGERYQKKIE